LSAQILQGRNSGSVSRPIAGDREFISSGGESPVDDVVVADRRG